VVLAVSGTARYGVAPSGSSQTGQTPSLAPSWSAGVPVHPQVGQRTVDVLAMLRSIMALQPKKDGADAASSPGSGDDSLPLLHLEFREVDVVGLHVLTEVPDHLREQAEDAALE
jgi:hypothetical protein